jgi:hypothetical protein
MNQPSSYRTTCGECSYENTFVTGSLPPMRCVKCGNSLVFGKITADSLFAPCILKHKQPSLVYYAVPWADASNSFFRKLKGLGNRFANHAIFYWVNVDDGLTSTEAYEISSVPTICIFSKGKLVTKISDGLTLERVEEELRRVLGKKKGLPATIRQASNIGISDLTNKIERLEAFEERLGVHLEALYASLNDTSLNINGELHVNSGTTLETNLKIDCAVYDGLGRILASDSNYIITENFYGFEVFNFSIYEKSLLSNTIAKIRVFPKVH